MRRLFLFTALVPAIARAEVMDKEFSLSTLVVANLVGAVLIFVAARMKPAWLALLIPVAAVMFWAQVSELLDPYVGPAMVTEGGPIYVVASWAAPVIATVACAAGLLLRRKEGRRRES